MRYTRKGIVSSNLTPTANPKACTEWYALLRSCGEIRTGMGSGNREVSRGGKRPKAELKTEGFQERSRAQLDERVRITSTLRS